MPINGEIIGSLITVFWVWMLIDCLFNRSLRDSKIGWVLFIIFTQIVGAMIYFFVKCNNHNPVEAVSSYYKTVQQWTQATTSPPQTTYYTPEPSAPPLPMQHDYQQGYSAYQYQPPQQQAIIPLNQVSNTPAQQSSDEQYEQPMISYPEMP